MARVPRLLAVLHNSHGPHAMARGEVRLVGTKTVSCARSCAAPHAHVMCCFPSSYRAHEKRKASALRPLQRKPKLSWLARFTSDGANCLVRAHTRGAEVRGLRAVHPTAFPLRAQRHVQHPSALIARWRHPIHSVVGLTIPEKHSSRVACDSYGIAHAHQLSGAKTSARPPSFAESQRA